MTFDPLVEERVAPGVVVGRGSNGNPKIVPRGGTVEVEYERASNLSSYLVKDIFGIKKWEKRLLAASLGRHPDLAALAGVEGYNTGLGLVQPILSPDENKASGARLDEIIARAEDRIGMNEKADMGTVAHAATEPGFTGVVPDMMTGIVDAIHELTAGLEVIATEVFVANDATQSAGTFDHGYYLADQGLARELSEFFTKKLGFTVDLTGAMIGDKKTGKNIHMGEFEVQVGGTYASGEVYLGPPIVEPDGSRIDQRLTLEEFFGGPVNRTTALLVHASTTGAPKPRVLPLDVRRGRDMANACTLVKQYRDRMDRIGIPKPLDMKEVSRRVLDAELQKVIDAYDDVDTAMTVPLHEQADALREFHEASTELYRRFKHVWTQTDTDLVKMRLT